MREPTSHVRTNQLLRGLPPIPTRCHNSHPSLFGYYKYCSQRAVRSSWPHTTKHTWEFLVLPDSQTSESANHHGVANEVGFFFSADPRLIEIHRVLDLFTTHFP
eukprot:GHVS01022981.1.p1 GENE.GHVS01022981.1~~GHVS01022981.1.p1  ORF type:complete len:104 (+),score=3.02 GHVS01022981.1:128-439(+)